MKTACLVLVMYLMGSPVFAQVEHYTSQDFDCAIFGATYPTDFEGKAFVPTHDEVDKACKALMEKLKTTSCASTEARHEIVKNLTKYKFQFFGFTDSKGNKILFINSFLIGGNKEIASSWLHDMIEVDNAGSDFWSVRYNLVKDQLYEFNDSGGK